MPDTLRKVEYFTIFVSHKPAEAFRVLSTLVSADVNLLACSGVPRGRRAQIDVVPEDTQRFKSAVKKAKLEFKPQKSGFLIQGRDRPGALTDYLRSLGEKNINVTGIDALSAGDGRWGSIIWVDDDAVSKAGALVRSKSGRKTKAKRAKKRASTSRSRK